MENKDVRWQQRFKNYLKAFSQLELFVEKGESLNHLEQQGLIKAFEYTYELAWNTIKDFYYEQGEADIQGSRDAIRLAFKRGLIVNGEVWMDMLKDRNRTSHSYNEEIAKEIVKNILEKYHLLFKELKIIFENK
jgi:nucleotidyltransferase substrate binding protein (TIGR01987 family)